MPKLIRLTTTDENARFESRFNSDIIIKPGSRIALQNLSMEVSRSEIVIDSANDLIRYSLKGGTEYTTTLTHDEYSAANATDLLNDIAVALNSGISTFSGKEIGAKYFCNEDSTGKIAIGYNINPYDTFSALSSQVLNNAYQAVNNAYRQGGTPGDFDSYISSDNARPILKGCTSLRIKLKAITDANGICLALCDKPASTIGTASIANVKYGLQVVNNAGTINANYIVNGTPTQYPTAITATGYIELRVYNGVIEYVYYATANSNAIIIHNEVYNFKDNIFPYIFFVGADSNIIDYKLTKVSLDNPSSTVSGGYYDIDGAGNLEALPTSSARATDNYINLGTPTLASFLGFNNTISPTVNAINYTLTADEKFQPTDISDSFLVMLDSFNLSSYDSYDNTRKSLLAVVPKSDNNLTGEVIYEPNYPTFIDIDNAYEMSIRNIRARILKNDLSEIVTNGLTTLTLLIE